jgi:G3E family GTPase
MGSGGTFSEKLGYLYRKQIEESEILVVNKCDLVSTPDLAKLRKVLTELAPHATMLNVSARSGTGMEDWLNCVITKTHTPLPHPPLDRALLAEAEGQLGWLNCTVKVSSVRYFSAGKLLLEIATMTQSLLRQDGLEVAHLKLLLCAENESTGEPEYLSAHMVHNDLPPEIGGEIRDPVQRAELTVNLRAEAKPELLHAAVNRAVLEIMERSPELFARMEHCEHFSRGALRSR